MMMKTLLIFSLISITYSIESIQSFTGRELNANCPPLQPKQQTAGLRQCQLIISLDNNGCRQISQDCSKNSQCQNSNEIFWQCSQECEPACHERSPNCRRVCGAPKCQCAPGFYRNGSNNKCVPVDQCPPMHQDPSPQCQFGEVLVRQNCSALTCERTCEGNIRCNNRCNQLMCLCPEGIFRDLETNRCVPRNQCPANNPSPQPTCTRDDQCRGDSTICTNRRCVQGCTSHNQCSNGMQCRSGRCSIPTCTHDNHCIRGTICQGNRCIDGCRSSSQCSHNSFCVENQCRQAVECRSDSHCGRNHICINASCRLGCRHHNDCANGFGCSNNQCVPMCFRDSDCDRGFECRSGRCIRETPRCRQGEIFSTCGTACEPSCDRRNPVCTQQCVPKCVCQRGLIRHRSGQCVPSHVC